MRPSTFLVASALAGLSVAYPQAVEAADSIDIDAIETQLIAPTSAPVDNPSAAGSLAIVEAAAADTVAAKVDPVVTDTALTKRAPGDCAAQPKGFGPLTTPDTAADFLANPVYADTSNAAITPSGYTKAFSGAVNSVEGNYYTYYNLKSYDTVRCQQYCDAINPADHEGVECRGFNVYYERDPSKDPGPNCLNPISTTNIKCALFGTGITEAMNTNRGQGRYQFDVVMAGSSGFSKDAPPATPDGFSGPVLLPAAINAPDNSYIGYKFFPGGYNPTSCANACKATTDYNSKHPRADGSYNTCSFFNSYVLSKNGVPQGTYCSQYTKTWGRQYATNSGQFRGSDVYSVSQSYGWTLTTDIGEERRKIVET